MRKLSIFIGLIVVLAGSALALAPAALSAPKPTCKTTVNSALAENGYNPSKLSAVSGRSESAINQEILNLCAAGTSPPQTAAQVLKDSSIAVTAIGAFLGSVFNLSPLDAAQVLKGVGFGATDIATALAQAFGQTPVQTAQVLQSLGFTAIEVAQALKNIGVLATQVAQALNVVFGLAAGAAAQVLKTVGYLVTEVAQALQTYFGLVADQRHRS